MPDLQAYLPYLAFAGIGLVALLFLFFVFRSWSHRSRGRKGMRLGIVEYCEVDQTRRLVLLRRDDVEHLVLIGGNQDMLVEGNIGIPAPMQHHASAPAQLHEPLLGDDPAQIRAPRAPVFGARRPMLRPVVNVPRDDDQGTI